MKSINKFLMVAVAAATLTSCLKDKNVDDQVYGMTRYDQGKIVELPAPPSHFYFKGLELKDQDTTFALVTVGLAADQVAQEDIKVNLTLANSTALLTEYNNANGTGLIQLPSALYTMQGTGLSVTIPKGERFGTVQITVNPNDLDPAESYGLGFTIASVETAGYKISGNFGDVVVGVGVKNKYDGIYKMTGTFIDLTNPLFTYYGEQELWLETQNATQVLVWNETLGTYGYLFLNNGAPTYYGSFGLLLTFDPATDEIVSVVNAYGQPSSNGRSAALDPSGLNRWDPATRNIDIKYYLLQPGTTIRSKFDEHWEYVGPRP